MASVRGRGGGFLPDLDCVAVQVVDRSPLCLRRNRLFFFMYSTLDHDLPDRHVIMNIAAFVFHL